MRKAIAILGASLVFAGALPADTTVKKTPPQNKSTAAVRKKTPTRRAPTRTWRAGQMAPTPERYKEIQDALARKGYLHGESSGAWDQESADALRRFQQDQNLQPSGKLNSLSLIALGLGPKHDAAPDKPPASQP